MVDDLPPIEFGKICAAETVGPRISIDYERIFEPIKKFALPRRLEAKGGNAELREVDGNGKTKDEGRAAGAIDRLALHDPARLANAQAVARNAADFSVIFGDENGPARGPNPSCHGQAVVGFILHHCPPFRFRVSPARIWCSHFSNASLAP